MNKTIMFSLIAMFLIVAGTMGVFAYNKQDTKIIPCSSCGNGCTAETNCGSANCGALNGGSCNCNASSGCGSCNGSCGGSCGLAGCSASTSTTKSCGCKK